MMKYLLYVCACILNGGMNMHAMDDQLVKWAAKIEKVAGQLPALADRLPHIQDSMLDALNDETFQVPEELKRLSGDLQTITCEMLARHKIPVIEQDILTKTTDLFEQEIKDLRPESAIESSRDRRYIKNYLQEFFKNKKEQDWSKISEKDMPYIPNLIDYMIANRQLNERAKLTLHRAKLDSKFYPAYIDQEIIGTCLHTHVQGAPKAIEQYITQNIRQQGYRYFAAKVVYQWAHDGGSDADIVSNDQEQGNQQKRVSKKRALEEGEAP